MEATPSKNSKELSPEKDEIPPDSDLKNQFKQVNASSQIQKESQLKEENQLNQENEENYINQENEINQENQEQSENNQPEIQVEENSEENPVNEANEEAATYQINNINQQNSNQNQEGEEYQLLKAGEVNELNQNQNQNVYRAIESNQSYQVIQQNQNTNQAQINTNYGQGYQSIQYGQPYELNNKNKEQQYVVYQNLNPSLNNEYNQIIQTPSKTYQYQEIQNNYVKTVTPIVNKPIIINEGDPQNIIRNEDYQIDQITKMYQSKKIEDIQNSMRNNNYNTYNMSQFRKGIHIISLIQFGITGKNIFI